MSSELTVLSPSRLRNARVMRRLSSAGGAPMEDGIESFWGIELNSEKPEEEWSFKVENEEEDEEAEKDAEPDRDFMSHYLYVKMATLGKGLVKGEEQVVEVETQDKDGKALKIPIINMVAGVNNTLCVNADFSDKHKVVFRLIEGSGPVFLSGSCLQEYPPETFNSQDESMLNETETTATDDDEEDEDEEVEEEEEDEDEDEEEEMEMEEKTKKGKGPVKRKPSNTTSKASKAKRSKLESKDEESEEGSEEEDDDDEDYEEEEDVGSKKKKGKSAAASPRVAAKSPKAAKPAAKKVTAAAQAAKAKKQKAKAK